MMQLKRLIIGQKYRKALNNSLDNVLWIPDNPFVDKRLSGHADLSVFSDKSGTIFAHKYLENAGLPKNTVFLDTYLDEYYPYDAKFNACATDSDIILNETTVAKEIEDNARKTGKRIFTIKQGYSNCCILVLKNDYLITSDDGIFNSLKNHFKILKIRQGYIDLDGFDYGFIGGAGFMVNDDEVAFTGLLDCHPDKDAIINFCFLSGCKVRFLTNRNIFDIGGAVSAE